MSDDDDWGEHSIHSKKDKNDDPGDLKHTDYIEEYFYEAEGLKDTNREEAIKKYDLVIISEETIPDKTYTVKCYTEILKLRVKLDHKKEQEPIISKLLRIISNYSKQAQTEILVEMLDAVNSSYQNFEEIQNLFMNNVNRIEKNKKQHLWLNVNLKIANAWIIRKKYDKVEKIIKEVKESQIYEDIKKNMSDVGNENFFQDIVSLDIQYNLDMGNEEELRKINKELNDTMNNENEATEPKIIGFIEELNGRMKMLDYQWDPAEKSFHKCFENFQDIDSEKAKQIFILYVIASILNGSQISPFSLPQANIYKENQEIKILEVLRNSYQEKDHSTFMDTLEKEKIFKDPFISKFVYELNKVIKQELIIKIVKSYTRLSITKLMKKLAVNKDEIRKILLLMINDKKLNGKLYDLDGVFVNYDNEGNDEEKKRLMHLDKILTHADNVYEGKFKKWSTILVGQNKMMGGMMGGMGGFM